ncbi:MAG: hypothetical protein K0S65_5946, partial [Labilithrix sp.]|nr:hypothetical protein [Labilithrix sp.]
MAAPPPKPKPPEDLAEVERALSVLQGRHPEHERLRREDEEKRRGRQAALDAESTAETRRVRSRRLFVGGIALAVGVVAVTGALVFRSELARRGRIEQAADPYRALGFVIVDTTSRGEPSKLEASAPAGCVLATSSTGGRLKLVHAGGTVEGPGPVLACLCEGGPVTVTADMKPGEGLALLRTDASAFGGSRAFAFLPFKPGATGKTDQACAEGSLDAWLDAKRWTQESPEGTARPLAPVDAAASDRWLAAAPRRAALKEAGFKVAAMVKREAPFSVVEVPAQSCVLLAAERLADRSSLRLRGGASAVGPAVGSVAWCTASEALVLAQREGEGEVAVLLAPAARAGGLAGVIDAASDAGMVLGAATVAPADRAWSAKQMLVASAIPESLITSGNAPDLGADPEARIVALSVEKPGALVAETPADVFSFCEPQLDKATATLCVFSGPQKWRVDGAEAIGGIARAKLPFWLFGLQGVNEPAALKLETELVDLARKLRRQGFEPTTFEAVTELDKGAEVLGRANEDAMVALTLAPVAPWIIPYTDG